MKRITAILTALMLIVTLAMPAFAEGYVESITAKPAPGVVGEGNVIGHVVDEDGNIIADIHDGDIVITPITEKDKLSDEDRDNLEKALKEITDGTAQLPEEIKDLLGENPVAKDLFDVTAVAEDIIKYLEEGHAIKLTFDANVGEGEAVDVAAYIDGTWLAAIECINNGDGTITVVLPGLCPVGIFVKGEEVVAPEATTEPTTPTDPVVGEPEGEGDCKICRTFFPYLGAAPLFHGVCIICFILIVLAICVVGYIIYRATKKDEEKKEENK